MDAAVVFDYLTKCELWAEARRTSEVAVLAAMRAEDDVRRAEERLRESLTGEMP